MKTSDAIRDTLALWRPEAAAKNNGDFISIETYSSFRMSFADPEAPEHIIAPDASDELWGKAILEALLYSRFLPLDEAQSLRLSMEQRDTEWIKKTMERDGYKTKNALFRKMKCVDMQRKDDLIILEPSHHAKLTLWTGD